MDSTFDPAARKRPVNLTLNAALVDRVKEHTGNLSSVVEQLLIEYLAQQHRARLAQHRVSEAAAAAWNTFNSTHGSIADEFSTL